MVLALTEGGETFAKWGNTFGELGKTFAKWGKTFGELGKRTTKG